MPRKAKYVGMKKNKKGGYTLKFRAKRKKTPRVKVSVVKTKGW